MDHRAEDAGIPWVFVDHLAESWKSQNAGISKMLVSLQTECAGNSVV